MLLEILPQFVHLVDELLEVREAAENVGDLEHLGELGEVLQEEGNLLGGHHLSLLLLLLRLLLLL